jgi:hypothetical protein
MIKFNMLSIKQLAELLEKIEAMQIELKGVSKNDYVDDFTINVKIGETDYPLTSMLIPSEFVNNIENQMEDHRRRIVQEIKDRL